MGVGKGPDLLNNLSRLLPSGTFIAFQVLAPISTNNGDCGIREKIATGLLLLIFFLLCFIFNFIDSITTESGRIYYGLVTNKGLYNPLFKKSKIPGDLKSGDAYFTGGDGNGHYTLQTNDYINAALSVVAFGTLSCLAPPVTTCYYPDLSETLIKTAPILVAFVVAVLFGVFPSGRHGVGFAMTKSRSTFVPDNGGNKLSGSQTRPPSGSTDGTNRRTDAEV